MSEPGRNIELDDAASEVARLAALMVTAANAGTPAIILAEQARIIARCARHMQHLASVVDPATPVRVDPEFSEPLASWVAEVFGHGTAPDTVPEDWKDN